MHEMSEGMFSPISVAARGSPCWGQHWTSDESCWWMEGGWLSSPVLCHRCSCGVFWGDWKRSKVFRVEAGEEGGVLVLHKHWTRSLDFDGRCSANRQLLQRPSLETILFKALWHAFYNFHCPIADRHRQSVQIVALLACVVSVIDANGSLKEVMLCKILGLRILKRDKPFVGHLRRRRGGGSYVEMGWGCSAEDSSRRCLQWSEWWLLGCRLLFRGKRKDRTIVRLHWDCHRTTQDPEEQRSPNNNKCRPRHHHHYCRRQDERNRWWGSGRLALKSRPGQVSMSAWAALMKMTRCDHRYSAADDSCPGESALTRHDSSSFFVSYSMHIAACSYHNVSLRLSMSLSVLNNLVSSKISSFI